MTQLDEAYDKLFVAGSKVGMQVHDEVFAYYILNKQKKVPKMLATRFMLNMRVAVVPGNNKLLKTFDRKLQQLFEADLINYYMRDFNIVVDKAKADKTPQEPFKVLTFEELEAGFVVCFVPLLFSIVVFMLEWLVTLKDLLVFRCIFEAFLKCHLTASTKVRFG